MPPPGGHVRHLDGPELFQQNQLRQRKTLPPLAPPPTELSMETHPLSPVNAETKAEMETLVRNHIDFARAFKLNDAAMLLPFLDKKVTLTTTDGAVLTGVSAVLGCLVGAKMGKLSGALHIKGRPTRSGPWQSAFVYEHGLVFKEPLYSEVVDWEPHSAVVTKITHTRLSSPLDAGPPKSVADVVKVVATLPHRLSLSDEDDYPASQLNRRSSLSLASVAALHSSVSSSDDDESSGVGGVVVTRVAVLSKLSPIRKRKLVNAFLTVESEAGAVLWKSSVAKKQTLPVWSGVELDIPPPLEEGEESIERVNNTPVVVTLWDYGFFRSLRVATAHVTAAQLLKTERVGIATLELKPMGLSTQSIQLSLSLLHPDNDREWRPRRSCEGSPVAAVDAAASSSDDEKSTAVVTKRSRSGFLDPFAVDGPWLVVGFSSLALLLCIAALWFRSASHVVAE